jgi:hypothetical protein
MLGIDIAKYTFQRHATDPTAASRQIIDISYQ